MNPAVLRLSLLTVLLDHTEHVWTLPPPSGVSMEPVDMRHVLKWSPLQAPCNTTVRYSVQFQGEFERTVLNGSWVDAHDCQQTPHTRCDLTFDLGSDSDYNLRVRGRCGSELSAWTRLGPAFNRRDTAVLARMEITAVGDALQVTIHKLPVSAVVMVTVWKRGDELQPAVYAMPAEQTTLHVAALQAGAEYCVRAQTVQSNSTDTQCVSVTGPAAAWKTPTSVTVTVVVTAALLFAVLWSVVRGRPDGCRAYFLKEPLPRSLRPDWEVPTWTSSEEAELCDWIHVVSSVEMRAEVLKL